MNKQEAIEKIEACKSLFISEDDTVFNYGLDKALSIVKQLDEPEKPVVPQFVAEWIKSQKESFSDVSAIDMYDNLTLDNNGGYYHEVWLWVIDHHYDFIKAWHDGYTVENEQQYVVAIPDDGRNGFIQLWKNRKGRLFFNFENKIRYGKVYLLTEQEIKQKDERLWQFAEEVKE